MVLGGVSLLDGCEVMAHLGITHWPTIEVSSEQVTGALFDGGLA